MKKTLVVALFLYCSASSALVLVDKDGNRYSTVVRCQTRACAIRQADENARRYGPIIAKPDDGCQCDPKPPEGFTGDEYMWRVHHKSKRSRTAHPIPEK